MCHEISVKAIIVAVIILCLCLLFYLVCYDTNVIPMILDCIDWLYICSFLFSVFRHTCHSDDCRLY